MKLSFILLAVPALLSSASFAASEKNKQVKDCPDLKTPIDLHGRDPLKSEIVLSNLRYYNTKFKVAFPDGAQLKIFNIQNPRGPSGTLGLGLFKDAKEVVGIPAAFSQDSAKTPKEVVHLGKVKYDLQTQNSEGFQIHNAEVTRAMNNPKSGPKLAIIHSRLKLKEGKLTYAALMSPVMFVGNTEVIGPSNEFAGYHETLCLESGELGSIP